jgi:predicted transcriptional regulator
MSSEGSDEGRHADGSSVREVDRSRARQAEQGRARQAEQGRARQADRGSVPRAEQGSGRERERVDLTDPKAMRALAHPLRWALLEALAQAGTLTATQASEMLSESPANCAFHLRTLAKYGFVEEAGGGRGRERPWRRTYDTLSWGRSADDPGVTIAAEALDQVWIDRLLNRARRSLTSTASWPQDLDNALGTSSSRLYVRPAEARRLYAIISEAFSQLADDPEIAGRRVPDRRPADAFPVEFVLLGYPVLDSPLLPADGGADDGEAAVAGDAHAGEADPDSAGLGSSPGAGPEPPEMSDLRDTLGGAG